MVKYKARVIGVEPVYGEDNTPIEAWVTFDVQGFKIETFHTGIPVAPELGKVYEVDIDLMAYYCSRINIEEKMLKQITKYPGDDKYGRPWPSIPMYFIMGEVVKAEKGIYEYMGEKKPILKIEVDCGIRIDTDLGGPLVDELLVGDYVAIIGKMFGEIVKE